MTSPIGPTVTRCTVRRHALGGYTPVLHLTGTPAPVPSQHSISLPTTAQAMQYARDHYGRLPVVVDDECSPPALRPAVRVPARP